MNNKDCKEVKLPDKPSELIRLALKDQAKILKSKTYVVDMDYWHTPIPSHPSLKCVVCFAGGVISQTLKCPTYARKFPEDFNQDTRNKLRALDQLRKGEISEAYILLGIPHPSGIPRKVEVPSYHSDKKKFRAAMFKLAKLLEKRGQ